MRIRSFDYWAAPSLDEALNELDRYGADAKVIAGGTDLVLNMKKKNILPRRVISLHNLNDLDQPGFIPLIRQLAGNGRKKEKGQDKNTSRSSDH